MNYLSIKEVNGTWTAVTSEGVIAELTLVPKGLRAEHLIDAEGNVVAKRCTRCGKMTIATLEYFRADKRRFVGLQQKCKSCHKEWDEINKAGKSINGGPKKTQKPKADRIYNDAGECLAKRCSICGEIKIRQEFRKHSKNPDGMIEYCYDCYGSISSSLRVKIQNNRATEVGLPGTLTDQQWGDIFYGEFDGKCALTGESEDLSFDHAIPLCTKHGGTVEWNVYPIAKRLNSSKHTKNLFEWVKQPHVASEIDTERFEKLVAFLAEKCGLTPVEYEDFYNWTFTAAAPNYLETGQTSLSLYKSQRKQANLIA